MKKKNKKPRSPLLDWWGVDSNLYTRNYGKWLPAGWEGRLRPMQEWLWATFKDAGAYEPVDEKALRWADD